MESVLTFMQRYHDDDDEFLDQIITSDDEWVAYITPVNALASQWVSLQDIVDVESNVHGVLGRMKHSPLRLADQKWDGKCWVLLWNTAENATGHSEQAAQVV